MLIKCPECQLQVSDKAIACPHCGYPMTDKLVVPLKRPKKAHRRLPNGFGQISEIKGKSLRKPFRAMITVGKTPEGRPICKILKPEGYFSTYNEAYAALVKYNQNPYDLDQEITMDELYERWKKKHFKEVKEQSTAWISTTWSYCSQIYDIKVRNIRTRHIKGCIDNGYVIRDGKKHFAPNSAKRNMKALLNMLLDYAVEYELIDRNYSRSFNLSKDIIKNIKKDRIPHISFSDQELETLWKNRSLPEVELILVQCYTGLRPQELCDVLIENVRLNDHYIIAGTKTDAGIDRKIPIHSSIFSIIEKYNNKALEIGSSHLFNLPNQKRNNIHVPINYPKYKYIFDNTMMNLKLNPSHRPHDPRKTFTTLAKNANMDEYAIKRIVGHRITDITESVYTDRDPKWLNEEIEKIKVNALPAM